MIRGENNPELSVNECQPGPVFLPRQLLDLKDSYCRPAIFFL